MSLNKAPPLSNQPISKQRPGAGISYSLVNGGAGGIEGIQLFIFPVEELQRQVQEMKHVKVIDRECAVLKILKKFLQTIMKEHV